MKLPNALRPAAIGKFAVTAAVVAAAVYAGWQLWVHYEVEPWTRDGRVKAYVVQVAPDVSGLVTAVPVRDNQDVKAGDVLFEIDRARFQLAFDQAEASVRSQQVAREQALRDAKRNRSLGQLVAAEALEQSQTKLQPVSYTHLDVYKRQLARWRVNGAMMMRLGRVNSPTCKGSNSRLIQTILVPGGRALGSGGRLHVLIQLQQERGNHGFIATEEHPLPHLGGRNQPRALQHREVRRHGGLRQPAAPIDMARAHPVFEGMPRPLLEVRLRRLQPPQDLAAHGIGQRLEDGVDINVRGGLDGGGSSGRHIEISQFIESYIETSRYIVIPLPTEGPSSEPTPHRPQ